MNLPLKKYPRMTKLLQRWTRKCHGWKASTTKRSWCDDEMEIVYWGYQWKVGEGVVGKVFVGYNE